MLRVRAGFSLLELLVAMAAGLMVLAMAFSLLTSLLVTGNTNLQLSRLNQEIHTIGDVIARDIQRAGFYPHASSEVAMDIPAGSGLARQLAFSAADDLYPNASHAHCLRVKFWDADAPAGEQLTVRIYHFEQSLGALRVHTHHDVHSVIPLSHGCGLGNQLTSSKEIRVQQLAFSLTPESLPQTRSIALVMSAAYVKRPELAQTLHRRILLRNQGGGL